MAKILVSRSGFLGDVCLSTASLRGIKQKHPGCDLTYSTWQQCGDLLALNPHIDQLRQPGRLMCSDFDVMVDFRHEAKPPRFTGDDNPLAYWGRVHAMQCRDAGLLDPMDSYKPELFIGPGDMVRKEGDMLCVINAWSQNGVGWRLWPVKKWERLVVALKKMGYTVAQAGGKNDPKIPGTQIQLCGKTIWHSPFR